jgi:4'-phosphopantetheinyl transferase
MHAPLVRGTVQVHVIRPAAIPLGQAEDFVTAAELSRAASFVLPEHASHWLRCRAALRAILAVQLDCAPRDVDFTIGEFGKPLLRDGSLHFNLSHERDLALVALSLDGPVGIDIEHLRRAPGLTECAATFCHPHELAALPAEREARNLELLRLWTAKEAYLKALGTGLSLPPESVCLTRTPLQDSSGQPLHLTRLDHPALIHHIAHLCAPHDTIVVK